MTKTILKATSFLALAAAFSGCDAQLKSECQNLFSAINGLQSQHVSARPGFDGPVFRMAQLALLNQHHIEIPAKTPSDPLDQCIGTLDLLAHRFPSTAVREFTLELLSDYARQWDPHSNALSEQALSSQSGFLTGFGFTVERSDDTGRVEVVDVIAGSPAHSAGLQEGMFIWTINHHYVREISTTDLTAIINDQSAESLVLGVLGSSPSSNGSASSYHEITVHRGFFEASPIKFSSTRTRTPRAEYSVGYVKIRNFVGAEAIFAEALKTMRTNDALILDLRDISGGDIETASDMADLLLADSETFVGLLDRMGMYSGIVRMRNLSSAWDGPLVVLVNSGTKSAAEILAGALQDYGAIVIGTRTFGKGTRQTLKPLGPYGLNGGLYLTDAFTVRPSGKIIQFRGVTPDIQLPLHGQVKTESSYPRALLPPDDRPPLPGYDPSAVFSRSPNFRKRLAALEAELRAYIEARAAGTSQEDLQLEAATRVATFLANESDQNTPSPGAPARATQLDLPFATPLTIYNSSFR